MAAHGLHFHMVNFIIFFISNLVFVYFLCINIFTDKMSSGHLF
ncbi:MAG: hypothetical protein GY777_25185 [Candidatus Brocadiaceae bacterium]|nr:hypothetical protein [Candidatus Brocadiaceae bacterium]